MNEAKDLQSDPELNAILQVHSALAPLNEEARQRVLDYVSRRLEIALDWGTKGSPGRDEQAPPSERADSDYDSAAEVNDKSSVDDLDGISPIATKWMRRNGLEADKISKLYSLGIDDIDLVVESIPGNSKRKRAGNVFRLVAIATYLASGAARATHEQVKEACLHYDAYDATNHAKTLRSLEGEISGTKESGYTLTAKGITAATSLIKEMVA